MKKFKIHMVTKVSKEIEIEAETAEDAVLIAKRDFTEQTVEVSLYPDWLDLADKAAAFGEYSMEFQGYCDRCGYPLIQRHERIDGSKEPHPKAWPYLSETPSQEQVGEDYNRWAFTWCYGCLRHPLIQLAEAATDSDNEKV